MHLGTARLDAMLGAQTEDAIFSMLQKVAWSCCFLCRHLHRLFRCSSGSPAAAVPAASTAAPTPNRCGYNILSTDLI